MKLLITGATGFLGSHLVKNLVGHGHDVVILKRSHSNTYRISAWLNQIYSYDVDQCNLEQPFRDHGKFDAVIHTATSYGRKGENVCDVFSTNTGFPLRLMEIAACFNTGIFFNADTILNKDLNSYSLSKKQFLEWGRQFTSEKKIRFVNIKLEHMYGPQDDETKFSTYVIKSCLANVPELRLTLGEQKRDFVYIDDVVSAYSILLNQVPKIQDYFQEYELGTGQPVSIRRFVEMVHNLTQSQTHLCFGAIPYREHEIMESYANIEKLQQVGWKPVTCLAEGIKKTIKEEK